MKHPEYEYSSIASPKQQQINRIFKSSVYETSQQFERWKEYTKNVGDLTPLADVKRGFDAELIEYSTPMFTLSRYRASSATRFIRDTNVCVDDISSELFVFQYRLNGLEKASSLSDEKLLKPGDLRLIDLAQPLCTEAEEFDNLSIVIPKKIIFNNSLDLSPLLHGLILRDNPMAKVLTDSMRALFNAIPYTLPNQIMTANTGLVDLIEATIQSTECVEKIMPLHRHSYLLQSLQMYIMKHYPDSSLTSNSIANSLGVSRAKLYRCCQPYTSPITMLKDYRLSRANSMLIKGDVASITALAYDLGFSSLDTFTRTFKQKYGILPSALQRKTVYYV